MGESRILIVEDDFLGRNLLSRIVAGFGSVDTAVDGQEAVDAVKAAFEAGSPYDLVLLDIMMPGKDGHTALREIREFERSKEVFASDGCKVVMTTALGDAKNVMSAFKNQCEGYITKPYTVESVTDQILKLGFTKG